MPRDAVPENSGNRFNRTPRLGKLALPLLIYFLVRSTSPCNFGTISIRWLVWCNRQNPRGETRTWIAEISWPVAPVFHWLRRVGDAFGESGPLTKMIFPFSAGGGGDTLCRLVAQYAGQLLDRTIIVENRTGGDGLIGIKWVKNASPDGTSILVTTGPTMYLLPMVEAEPSFDLDKDFVPVSLLARFEFGVVDGPRGRCEGLQAFCRLAQGQPGQGHIRRARATVPFRISRDRNSSRCSASL